MDFFKKKLIFKDGIYSPLKTTEINNEVLELYSATPFPNYNEGENLYNIMQKGNNNFLAKNIKDFIGFGKNILEIGCGTAQLSNYSYW